MYICASKHTYIPTYKLHTYIDTHMCSNKHRHTETHRDTQRHTETHRDTYRHTETHKDTQRHTETHSDTQ
jgi:hypothetical protein